jgi:HEAT repeat protein
MEGFLKRVGLEQILEDLTDNDPEIKKLAAKALLKDSSCSDELVTSVLQDADKATSAILYETLFEDGKDFPDVFHAATSDPDPAVRRMAIRYLFRRGAFALDDGIAWLGDSDPYVRRRVISYLFWINDRSALEPVVRLALEDPEQTVRKDALRLVGIWGGKGEIPHAIKALEDSSMEVRMQAIRTLKRLTGEDFGEPSGDSEDEFEWIIAKWQGWWELMKERI